MSSLRNKNVSFTTIGLTSQFVKAIYLASNLSLCDEFMRNQRKYDLEDDI